jgi:hypothetical protein
MEKHLKTKPHINVGTLGHRQHSKVLIQASRAGSHKPEVCIYCNLPLYHNDIGVWSHLACRQSEARRRGADATKGRTIYGN